VSSIKAKIRAAGKKYGIEFSDDERSADVGGEVERRNTVLTVELRHDAGNKREIGGYAALFNRDSKNMPYIERVMPSFFAKSRADGWPGTGAGVVCRYNHDDMYLLGTTRSGTLRLSTDEQGLDYTVDVPEHRKDVMELVSRGDITQSSFAFIVTDEEWDHTESGTALRKLVQGKLIDVAPVVTPAYEDTTVGLRSLARAHGVPEEDVFSLAEQRELRKLFIRTDPNSAPKSMSGQRARMYMMGKRPKDPIAKVR